MFSIQKTSTKLYPVCIRFAKLSQVGSNVNKPGKGAIRMTAGAQGKIIAAHEEEYFYMQHKEQLEKLKNDQIGEGVFHRQAIKDHKEAILRHEKILKNLENKENVKM